MNMNYNLYCLQAAEMQNIDQNADNKDLIRLLDLKKNCDYKKISSFIQEFCEEEEFENNYDYSENVKLYIKKTIEHNCYNVNLTAERYGQTIMKVFCRYSAD